MEQKELPFDRFSAIFQEQISRGRYDCLICERDGKAVGVLNLRFEKQLHHCEAIAEIMEFAVDAAYRGQEIGKKMLAIAMCALLVIGVAIARYAFYATCAM